MDGKLVGIHRARGVGVERGVGGTVECALVSPLRDPEAHLSQRTTRQKTGRILESPRQL